MNRQDKRQAMLDTLPLGTHVRVLAPNTSWGEGVIAAHICDLTRKPFVVRREDGTSGFFHLEQIERT